MTFKAVLLDLLAGIFEETARLILLKSRLKNVKTWVERKTLVLFCSELRTIYDISLRNTFLQPEAGHSSGIPSFIRRAGAANAQTLER